MHSGKNKDAAITEASVKLENPENGDATSLRDDLIAIINEIVEKKRTVVIENLLKIAPRRIGAERLVIENVIDRLIEEKVIVPGSRIIRKIILHNKTRESIYDLIKQFPGININTLKTKLSLGPNAVLWHLGVLLKFGCVQEIHYKTSTLFALPHFADLEVIVAVLLRKELPRGILSALKNQSLSLSDLESSLGENRRKIAYTIKNLQELSVVELIEDNESNNCDLYQIHPNIFQILSQMHPD
ncbi:MAG TPA: hypothetical protein VKK79_02260 [Candidatus Lokiarchaeia archaeon]|nr:hypothetical protein [Candidatus Lokiarchaeia archaeon]